ncbi:unnamed protein product [Arctia plantaginis]|uniref:FLYWCH-type domain-containing protein n=1 Tax=Arctia plantaginis TaxID=874455 RepID=A0A8S1AT08_ARCPL|nr:unnamed protein product [Arctia plantaginis]
MFSVLLVKGRNGKDLLMLNGYTYYQHKILRDGFRWSCTQMGSRSCRGFLHVTNEMMVVRAFTEHTHPPSTYLLKSTKKPMRIKNAANNEVIAKRSSEREALNPLALKIAIEFYLRPNGRINLRLNNFTFYKHLKARSNAHRWSCTAYGSKWKCKAHLIITDTLEVLKANILHSHPPSMKKETRLPLLKEIKKDLKQALPKPMQGRTDPGAYFRTLTPFQNYLAAHSVFGGSPNVKLIELMNGRTLLLVNGYPHYKKQRSKDGSRWCCSKAYCNAFLRVSHDLEILYMKQTHEHPPAKFLKSRRCGKYVRIP